MPPFRSRCASALFFAPFYGLLLPLGICAGLGLPTLALLRGAEVRPPNAPA